MSQGSDTTKDLLTHDPLLAACLPALEAAVTEMINSLRNGGRVFTFGNGGSAADADHIVGELVKPFRQNRPLDDVTRRRLAAIDKRYGLILSRTLRSGIPAHSLTGPSSIITAIANDMSPDVVFAQQVLALARAGDVCIALSTSGNSANVINGAAAAIGVGASVIALTGKKGGRLGDIATTVICVPEEETFLVQQLHLSAYHWICDTIELELFGGNNAQKHD